MKADWGKLAKRVRGHLAKMVPEHAEKTLSVAAHRCDWVHAATGIHGPQTSFFACYGADGDLIAGHLDCVGVNAYGDLPAPKAIARVLRDALMADLAARSGATD